MNSSTGLRMLALIGALAVLASPGHAFAGTLYSQPPTVGDGSGPYTAWTSSFTDPSLDFLQTLDNFQVSADGTIASIDWQGIYLLYDPNTGQYSNGTPNTNDWIITLYTSGGAPDFPFTQVASETIGAGGFSETPAGTTIYGSSTVDFYDESAVLPTPISIQGGQAYYLSIFSDNGGSSNIWLWMSGSGGDGSSWQYDGTLDSTTTVSGDRTFTLAAVPEPPGLILGMIAAACLIHHLDRRWGRLRRAIPSGQAARRGE